ncbi:MAG: hypothetical protein ABI822_33895, partial [Bryobacteraceae bacterium]
MAVSINFRRLAIGILAGILALGVLTVALIHTPPVRRFALRKVQGLIHQEGFTLDSTGLDYNLFKGSISLHNVVIRSTAAPDLPPIAQIALIQGTIDIWNAIHGSYIISDAKVNSPNIHILIDASGRDNIPKP